MKKNYYICLSILLWLMAFLLAAGGLRRRDEALAARIAPEILRFHVLANSDSAEDQALKLEVKDLLLGEIRNGVLAAAESQEAPPASSKPRIAESQENGDREITKSALCAYILKHKTELERTAETCMAGRGFDYTADIRLEQCEFPEKTYGDMTFPAGTYDAVRVLIGQGQGKNFWCVLYPSLCYLDSSHAVVPDDSKEQLKALVAEDDFNALLAARRLPAGQEKAEQESLLPRIRVRFKLADLIRGIR